MRIDKKLQYLIHRDAKAKIASDGLIGNKIIIIYGGTHGMPSAKSGDTLWAEKTSEH